MLKTKAVEKYKVRAWSSGKKQKTVRNKVILNSDIYMVSVMDGTPVTSMSFPQGALIVSVLHEEEFIPNGESVLYGGDKISILCAEDQIDEINNMLNVMCRTTEV